MRRNRSRGIRSLALRACALTLAALAAGCGGGEDDAEQPRQVGEAGGLEVYEVASQGFSLGIPPEWRVVSVDEALPEEEREQLARENPSFAPILEAIGDEDQPFKLLAFDPDVRDDFATNLNVLAVDLPSGVDREQFVEANKADLEDFEGLATEIDSQTVDLPAGSAERLEYRLRVTTEGNERQVASLQYFLVGEDTGYVVTFSTLPQHSARYEADFERIIRSLTLG